MIIYIMFVYQREQLGNYRVSKGSIKSNFVKAEVSNLAASLYRDYNQIQSAKINYPYISLALQTKMLRKPKLSYWPPLIHIHTYMIYKIPHKRIGFLSLQQFQSRTEIHLHFIFPEVKYVPSLSHRQIFYVHLDVRFYIIVPAQEEHKNPI